MYNTHQLYTTFSCLFLGRALKSIPNKLVKQVLDAIEKVSHKYHSVYFVQKLMVLTAIF